MNLHYKVRKRFPFCQNCDSHKNGLVISIHRTGDGFHPGLFSKPIYVKNHAIITGIYNTQAGSSGFIIYFDKKKIVPHRYEIEGSLTNISIGKVNMDQQKLEGEDVITIVGFELPANITQYEIEGLKQTINVNDGKIFNVILVDHQNDSIYNIGLLDK